MKFLEIITYSPKHECKYCNTVQPFEQGQIKQKSTMTANAAATKTQNTPMGFTQAFYSDGILFSTCIVNIYVST